MSESKNNIYIDKENTRLERMAKEQFTIWLLKIFHNFTSFDEGLRIP